MSTEPIRPNGVTCEITDQQQIVIRFDHGEIPPVVLGIQSGVKVGSLISSQANKARNSVESDCDG